MEREQELDIDLPAPKEPDLAAPNGILGTRDDWEYSPPERDHADVKEVWFAGDFVPANTSSFTYNYQVPIRMLVEAPILRNEITVYLSSRFAG